LPEVLETRNFKKLELFSLPSVLPGSNKPGLHEVEVLERARKRWAFSDALKVHFQRLLCEARKVAIKTEFKEILEAFEWEQWIQREEDIQECQMMRLQIVIKMFDKREKEMHAASKSRIEKACERIEERRLAGLRKNEIEFQRGMRRLEIQVTKTPRRWEKQKPMHSLGSPCSEFYAPLLRYGVDPAHRNYVSRTGRNAFDMRIDELEKKVNMNQLKCPFRKLKDWSKPKKYDQEYERNFCKEDNLQKLFECLKALRTQAAREKEDPKCLKKRRRRELGRVASQMTLAYLTDLYDVQSDSSKESSEKGISISKYAGFLETEANQNSEIIMTSLKNDRKREGMENLLNIYEGTYVGWVMQFLSEEMSRLSELRRLHFFAIMAQKERWRREAAEAGLRQKENDMRLMYEELFQNCNVVNNEISNKYFAQILSSDMYNVADSSAAETVSELAQQIDTDIERWLESFKLIQNPLTYVPLRLMLNDLVSPDMDQVLQRYENSLIVQYVVEDVIFQKVWTELDPFDIATTLTSDLIDRLIDNDLYLMSTDSESEIPQKASWREVNAIIRKLIRRAVPGRRWLEENERIVTENYNDLFDDLFVQILQNMENPPPVESSDLIDLRLTPSQGDIRSTDNIREKENINMGNISLKGSDFMGQQTLALIKRFKDDHITGALVNVDKPLGDDPPSGSDQFINSQIITPVSNLTKEPSAVFSLRSTLDLSQVSNLASLIGRGYRVMLPSEVEKNIENLVKESEDKILEPIKDIEEHEVRNKMEKEEQDLVLDIDSPKVSFHEMQVPIIPAKEISPEAYHPPIFLDNKEEQIAEEEQLPLEITLDNLETKDSTPKEIKSDVDPIPKELTPISSGSNDIKKANTTNDNLETIDSTPKEIKSVVDRIPKELTPISSGSKDIKPTAKELVPPEGNMPVMVEESDSFIPPVRSSGLKNLTPKAALLITDSTKVKGKTVPIQKDQPKTQVQGNEEEDQIEERRHRGSLGSHFNPLQAVIPIETSDDHLPVNDNMTADPSRMLLDPE